MPKSIKVTPKKRGRPATGRDPVLTARLPPDLTARIDYWATQRDLSRSEGMRQLIEKALDMFDEANRRKRK